MHQWAPSKSIRILECDTLLTSLSLQLENAACQCSSRVALSAASLWVVRAILQLLGFLAQQRWRAERRGDFIEVLP